MIFVTVGTHEQQFNRLIKEVDDLKGLGIISEEVIMQTGYCTYEPVNCCWNKLLPYSEIKRYISEARIIITHGGPASFIAPLQVGKIPIVVPRQRVYGEHVNNHQVDFVKAVSERMGAIIPVYDISDMQYALGEFETKILNIHTGVYSNSQKFNEKFASIVDDMFK